MMSHRASAGAGEGGSHFVAAEAARSTFVLPTKWPLSGLPEAVPRPALRGGVPRSPSRAEGRDYQGHPQKGGFAGSGAGAGQGRRPVRRVRRRLPRAPLGEADGNAAPLRPGLGVRRVRTVTGRQNSPSRGRCRHLLSAGHGRRCARPGERAGAPRLLRSLFPSLSPVVRSPLSESRRGLAYFK